MKLARLGPMVVGILSVAVIGFGLLYTLKKGLELAPHGHEANEGRLHPHMKNVTRFGGSPEQVAAAIRRAVLLDDSAAPADSKDWKALILSHVEISAAPRHVVVLPEEETNAVAWSLPGAYWAAYAGSPIVFAGRDQLSEEARGKLRQFGVPAYVLAPSDRISGRVLSEIRQIVRAERVAGRELAGHAVKIAEYRDPETGFGWGRTQRQRLGYFEFVVAAPSDALHAVAALPLARSNAAAFLFAGMHGELPPATDRYAWSQRGDWFVTPSEGPFRHFWIMGDTVSYESQGRLDLAIEKAPYASMGPVALGPMEALFLVFIALGIASGIFVYAHGRRLLPELMPSARIAWAFTAALVPVAGVLLYLAAYRRPRMEQGGHMPHWERPPIFQAASATAMGFGFGAPLMIAIGYLFVYFGFPLSFGGWAEGAWFLLGAGMPRMMLGMYIGAILIAWPLVQMPMKRMMGGGQGNPVWKSLAVTTVSMTAVSLGMMTASWWLMMWKLPMMPKEDELLWFGAMWLASAIGFLVAWPLNWPMVSRGMKEGTV